MYAPLSRRRLPSGTDLRTADLAGLALVRADLRGVDLSGLILDGLDLSGADLRGARLDEASLVGAALEGADLRGASLRGSVLREARLRGADLRGAELDGAVASGADLRDAELSGAGLAGVDLDHADVRRSVAEGARARGLRAEGARWAGADWRAADLRGANLRGLDAQAVRLDRATLAGACLDEARLERAVFDEADVEQASFRSALLVGAAFAGARGRPDLTDADLRAADLRFPAASVVIAAARRAEDALLGLRDVGLVGSSLEATGWRAPASVRVLVGAALWVGEQQALSRVADVRVRVRSARTRETEAPVPTPEEVAAPDEVVTTPVAATSEPVSAESGVPPARQWLKEWWAFLFEPTVTEADDADAVAAFRLAAAEREVGLSGTLVTREVRARLAARRARTGGLAAEKAARAKAMARAEAWPARLAELERQHDLLADRASALLARVDAVEQRSEDAALAVEAERAAEAARVEDLRALEAAGASAEQVRAREQLAERTRATLARALEVAARTRADSEAAEAAERARMAELVEAERAAAHARVSEDVAAPSFERADADLRRAQLTELARASLARATEAAERARAHERAVRATAEAQPAEAARSEDAFREAVVLAESSVEQAEADRRRGQLAELARASLARAAAAAERARAHERAAAVASEAARVDASTRAELELARIETLAEAERARVEARDLAEAAREAAELAAADADIADERRRRTQLQDLARAALARAAAASERVRVQERAAAAVEAAAREEQRAIADAERVHLETLAEAERARLDAVAVADAAREAAELSGAAAELADQDRRRAQLADLAKASLARVAAAAERARVHERAAAEAALAERVTLDATRGQERTQSAALAAVAAERARVEAAARAAEAEASLAEAELAQIDAERAQARLQARASAAAALGASREVLAALRARDEAALRAAAATQALAVAEARAGRLSRMEPAASGWRRALDLLGGVGAEQAALDDLARAFEVDALLRDEGASAVRVRLLRRARVVRAERIHRILAARDATRRVGAAVDRARVEAATRGAAHLRAAVVASRRHEGRVARDELVAYRLERAEVAVGGHADAQDVAAWRRALLAAGDARARARVAQEDREDLRDAFAESVEAREGDREGVALDVWRRASLERARRTLRVEDLPRVASRVRPMAAGTARPIVLGPGAKLAGADLEGRALTGVDLRGAELATARLVGVDLRGARLDGVDARGADFTGADLTDASFEDADLRGAVLDTAALHGAVFTGANLAGASILDVRGLSTDARGQLAARGARVGADDDGRWFRVASGLVAVALGGVVVVYLVARFTVPGVDDASLEQAATEAKQGGDPALAGERFLELAERAPTPTARIAFLVEAANAAEEAGDTAQALDLYAKALTASDGIQGGARVQLRLAAAQRRASLTGAAAASYRAVLARVDASPTEQGEAIAGLAVVLGPAGDADIATLQESVLAASPTPAARGGLALALADGWAGQGRLDVARTTLEATLTTLTDDADRLPLQLRLAHVLAQDGESDRALAAYRVLLDRSPEARLGAAEVLAGRGAHGEARALLAPLLTDEGADGARARLATATLASREGDDAGAATLLRQLLAIDGVEPRVADEARLLLARILAASDPKAASELADGDPRVLGAILLGQARALRDASRRSEARARWVAIAENVDVDPDARTEAGLALAELDVEDGDADAAVDRYEALMKATTQADLRRRVQLGYAAALVRLGRVQDAEAKFAALAAVPGSDELRDQAELGLARCAALRGQAVLAAQRYEAVAARTGSWGAEALLGLGELRQSSGDLAGAAEALRRARARPGLEAERRTMIDIVLAQVLESANDPAAESLYATLLAAPDARVRVQARLAVATRALGVDPKRARTLYDEALQEAGVGMERATARAGWMRAMVALGDVDGALVRMRAWLETETDAGLRAELVVAAVRGLRSEGRAAEALVLAERWSTQEAFELAMERAGALRDLGRTGEAAEVLSTVRGTSSEDELWRLETRAEALLAAGKPDDAGAVYAQLSTGTTAAAARLGLARVAREQGRYEEALALLAESDDPRAPVDRAQVLEAMGRLSEAETTWKRVALASDLEQRSAGVVGLARVRLEREDPKGALEALAQLVSPDPGYALTYAQARGEALLALGRFDEARATYAALGADAEARVVGLLGQAEVDLAVDRASDALARFEKATDQTSDPWYLAAARAGVVRAASEAGDVARARAAYRALAEAHPDRDDLLDAAASAAGVNR